MAKKLVLAVIPEPGKEEGRAVFEYKGEGAMIRGKDDEPDLLCGACNSLLITGVSVFGLIIRCNICGAYNDSSLRAEQKRFV